MEVRTHEVTHKKWRLHEDLVSYWKHRSVLHLRNCPSLSPHSQRRKPPSAFSESAPSYTCYIWSLVYFTNKGHDCESVFDSEACFATGKGITYVKVSLTRSRYQGLVSRFAHVYALLKESSSGIRCKPCEAPSHFNAETRFHWKYTSHC